MLRIGVFDSGLGGLTVVKSLLENIQNAKIFYVADSKNAPYGEKTSQQILKYSFDITNYLIKTHNIDVLILACNTATSYAIQDLRKEYPDMIIIGTEPGIKPAIKTTCTSNIGVLATSATLKGEKYNELVDRLSQEKHVNIYEQSCPGLVEQIERGAVDSDKTRNMLEEWLEPMKQKSVDTVVLGCTHYPLVEETIIDIMGSGINIVHTADAIASHVLNLSSVKGHVNSGSIEFYLSSTGSIEKDFVNSILSKTVKIETIDL